jgi:hypothetical protein
VNVHDPDKLLELAEALGAPLESYLRWKLVVDRYERGKASVLARGTQSIPDGSFAHRQSVALASEDYEKYLSEWSEAEKNMVKARIVYETAKSRFDAMQSVLAYERDSMRRLG